MGTVSNPEEVWIYAREGEQLRNFLNSFIGSEGILAVRSPYRTRITAKQELWYALIRASAELSSNDFDDVLKLYLGDVRKIRKEFNDVPDDSVNST